MENVEATAWYWCPQCRLASPKAGACPGCNNSYETAPTPGVPPTAYNPPVARGRSRFAVVGTVLAIVVVAAAVIGGIVLLGSHGAVLNAHGEALTTSSSNGKSSTFKVNALNGTLRLQGGWSSNRQMLGLGPGTTADAPITNELAVGNGNGENIAILSVPAFDRAGTPTYFAVAQAMTQLISSAPHVDNSTMEDFSITATTRDIAIAGHPTVAEDFSIGTQGGGREVVNRGTIYVVSGEERVVVIRAMVANAQAGDLTTIEQALMGIS